MFINLEQNHNEEQNVYNLEKMFVIQNKAFYNF